MKTVRYIIFLFLILNSPVILPAEASVLEQYPEPEIGKPVPEFQLENIANYKKSRMTASDFKGRYVILDFWNKNCISCVQSFPKLNAVHKKFKDKVDLVLVGTGEEGIEDIFATFRQKLALEFAFVFNEDLYKSFVVGGAPHLVWIDDKGIVKAITLGTDLTTPNIEAFLNNQDFKFTDNSHAKRKRAARAYDPYKPFLVEDNGGKEYEFMFRYRSLIAEYIPGTASKYWPDFHLFRRNAPIGIRDGDRVVFEARTNLRELYRTAYTGYVQWAYSDSVYNMVHAPLVLELSDSSLFQCDVNNETGFYWYSLVMPVEKNTPSYVMESMQNDLRRYFGYYARLETRRFPYLKIVASKEVQRLKTKGGTPEAKADHSMYKATNIPLEKFFTFLFSYHNYWESGGRVPVIINETGFKDNVDIDVKVLASSWDDTQRALGELGFSLVRAEKEFKVLVISDK